MDWKEVVERWQALPFEDQAAPLRTAIVWPPALAVARLV